MPKRRKYNPQLCSRRIVAQFEDVKGNKIALFAHHASKWSIYTDIDGHIVIQNAPRKEAEREYKRLKKVYSLSRKN